MRLIYCDDSGNADLAVYSFVEVATDNWNQALEIWLDARKSIRDTFSIPVRWELHAVDFLAGRGNPSTDPMWNRNRSNRLQVAEYFVQTLNVMPINWMVFYSRTRRRSATYRSALTQINHRLSIADQRALIMIDGDGSDPIYLEAHRNLDSQNRRIVEDPWYQGSHSNQWIMIADLIAYLGFQSIRNLDSPYQYWYQEHLLSQDLFAGPVNIY